MKSISRCVSDSLTTELARKRNADESAEMIRSSLVEVGTWSRPLVLEVVLTKTAMAWWCKIEVSKQIEDGSVIDADEFICGGETIIRWDAIAEAIVDKVSPYVNR